jgi:hypothetical protein
MNDTLAILDTKYAGDQQAFWWPRATVTMTTVAKNAVLAIDGIKKETTVTTLDTDMPLQDRQPEPVSDDNLINVDGRTVFPQDVMVYKEINPRDFEAHWNAVNLSKVLLARELPATAAAFITSQVLRRSFQYLDQCVWIGSTAYKGNVAKTDVRSQYKFFNGYLQRMVNDALVQSVAGVTTFSTSNIIGYMQSCITQCDIFLKANPAKYERLRFAMNPNSKTLFDQALSIGTTYKNDNYMVKGQNYFQGYEIIELYGIPDNTIVFGEFIDDGTGNFALGMNAFEDMQLELMRKQNNAETWFVKGLFKMDVNYGWGAQIVLATTLTANSFLP